MNFTDEISQKRAFLGSVWQFTLLFFPFSSWLSLSNQSSKDGAPPCPKVEQRRLCVPTGVGGPLATRKLRRTLPSRERRSVQAPVCPPWGPRGIEYCLPGLRWEQSHSWQNPNHPPWGWREDFEKGRCSHSWQRWALEGGERTSVSSDFPQVEKQVSLNGWPAKVMWWLGAEAGPAQQVLLTLLPSNHPIGTHIPEAVPSVFTKKCPQSEAQCRQGWGQGPSVDCPEEQVPALGAWEARGVPLPHQWTEISIRNELDFRTHNACRRTVVGTNSTATIWNQTLGRWACAASGLLPADVWPWEALRLSQERSRTAWGGGWRAPRRQAFCDHPHKRPRHP